MVFIIDLSDLGDEPAAILGAIIINAFKQAADAVGDPARPYRLYIDEFQNFGTSIISTILSASADYSSRSRINSFRSSTRRYRTPCSATARPLFHSGSVPTMPHYWESYQS
jgi:hypothetical protein